MPAKSEKQRKFFGLVRAIQKGEATGSSKAKKAAASMTPEQVKDFASKREGAAKKGLSKRLHRRKS